MAEAPKIERANIESWLSAPRYKRYLEVADGNGVIGQNVLMISSVSPGESA